MGSPFTVIALLPTAGCSLFLPCPGGLFFLSQLCLASPQPHVGLCSLMLWASVVASWPISRRPASLLPRRTFLKPCAHPAVLCLSSVRGSCCRIVPALVSLTFRCLFILAPVCLSSSSSSLWTCPQDQRAWVVYSRTLSIPRKPELPGCPLQGRPFLRLPASANMPLTAGPGSPGLPSGLSSLCALFRSLLFGMSQFLLPVAGSLSVLTAYLLNWTVSFCRAGVFFACDK